MFAIRKGREAAWSRWVDNNKDPYSRRCVSYAVEWAEAMERELESGKTVADCAQPTSDETDTDGITGFMFGAARTMLVDCWEYGEELKKWKPKE